MPGLFFQYDINALKFIITEYKITTFQLIIKIASTVGGLFLLFSKYIDTNKKCKFETFLLFFQIL